MRQVQVHRLSNSELGASFFLKKNFGHASGQLMGVDCFLFFEKEEKDKAMEQAKEKDN